MPKEFVVGGPGSVRLVESGSATVAVPSWVLLTAKGGWPARCCAMPLYAPRL